MTLDISPYHGAIIRFATYIEVDAKVPSLLFASVELLHKERCTPDSIRLNKNRPQIFDKSKQFRLAFRKIATSAEYAINWYRKLKESPTIPLPCNQNDQGKYDGDPIVTNTMVDEPNWPKTSTPIAASQTFSANFKDYPAPFIGAGAFPCKIHRQLSIEAPLHITIKGNTDAVSWLKKRIHFDISAYPELLGGAVLILPNPNVRNIDFRLTRNENGKEYIVGKVYRREGGDLSGLTLTIYEKRFGAISFYKNYAVGDGLIISDELYDIEQTGYILSHEEHGLIYEQEALSFIRKVYSRMAIADRKINIKVRNNNKLNSDTSELEITQYSEQKEHVIVQKQSPTNNREILCKYYSNSEKRRKSFLASQQNIQWFDNRDSAAQFIRKIVSQSNEKVMFIDPYASGEDLFNFGHFVTRSKISIKVLTSYAGFPKKNDDEIKRDFNSVISSFTGRGLSAPEIKLLPGRKNPPLHDRFLIIDNDIWTLGNSLNSIGDKAGILLKLPDPDTIYSKVLELYSISKII